MCSFGLQVNLFVWLFCILLMITAGSSHVGQEIMESVIPFILRSIPRSNNKKNRERTITNKL